MFVYTARVLRPTSCPYCGTPLTRGELSAAVSSDGDVLDDGYCSDVCIRQHYPSNRVPGMVAS